MGEIEPALAGQPLHMCVGTFDVVLAFPEFDGSSATAGYASWSGADASTPTALGPAVFTAHTKFRIPADAGGSRVRDELKAAVAAIRFGAARLSDALRVEQPHVGMVGDIPRMLSLTARDTTRGVDLAVSEPLSPGYPMVRGAPVLRAEAALSALQDGVSPPRALMSQARYLTQSTSSPQPGMAVMLAAIAAETFAKQALQSCRPAGSSPSLRSLQQIHGSAIDLYGPVADAVIGESLDVDRPALWAELGLLFTTRNKMAHQLKTPSHLDASRLVVAGMQAMDWLTSALENRRG
ncbi:hypothetical protein [Streptomyces sp. 8P21H-1]|uniref:hypothetical protein n=1 Tax=Streptomyces sp. 8P21H-1 TaxID=2737048 RepID=UPI001570AAE5|nr:hypothetical protein [Streptomyces sp. 8P21H-1]NSL43662.1 hypothetical protein [Streptomyces sp. 8P21H-1]